MLKYSIRPNNDWHQQSKTQWINIFLSFLVVTQVELNVLWPLWTVYLFWRKHCNIKGLFFIYFFAAFVEFHLPVFTSSFPSAVTIETLHPYQQVAFGCRAHWLSQERDAGEQVFPWHGFGTDVARKAFTRLWQCFLGSRRPTIGGMSTRFVTMGWRLRQSEIQLGEIHSCNWNEFTWETAAPRCLLAVNSGISVASL